MATASIWQEEFINAFMGSFENHCPLKASLLQIWPRTSLPSNNLVLLGVSHVFVRPLTITVTSKPHLVTDMTCILSSPDLDSYYQTSRCHKFKIYVCALEFDYCLKALLCLRFDMYTWSQLNRYLKASPFSSSLTRSRRLRRKVSFASTPTVRKSWCVWEIALIAKCEWSR